MPERSELIENVVSAGKRDLGPLLLEAGGELQLAEDQALTFGTYMTQTWIRGAQSSQEQLLARIDPQHEGPDMEAIQAEFLEVLEESADALSLSVPKTEDMWRFLARAWIAGVNSSCTESLALAIERDSDVTEQALRWLREEE
jgi:hypothetical protein